MHIQIITWNCLPGFSSGPNFRNTAVLMWLPHVATHSFFLCCCFVFKWVIVGWNSRAFKREWATFPSQRYAYAFAERFTWPQHFDMSRITVSISTHWGTLCTMTTTNCDILWTKLKSFNIDMVSILHFHMHVTHLKMERFLQDWYWQIDIQKENRNPL